MNRSTQTLLSRPKLIGITILVLVVGYLLARPHLENWLGRELPSLVQDEGGVPEEANADDSGSLPRESAAPDVAPNVGGDGFELKELGRRNFLSPAGLIYGMGPRGEHRIQHIMRHAKDDPSRPIHGVFDAHDEQQVLQLIDEAYRLVIADSPRVRRDQSGDREELTIDMQKRIGYIGGRDGKRRGHPACQRLRLIVEGQRVITAYPYR